MAFAALGNTLTEKNIVNIYWFLLVSRVLSRHNESSLLLTCGTNENDTG